MKNHLYKNTELSISSNFYKMDYCLPPPTPSPTLPCLLLDLCICGGRTGLLRKGPCRTVSDGANQARKAVTERCVLWSLTIKQQLWICQVLWRVKVSKWQLYWDILHTIQLICLKCAIQCFVVYSRAVHHLHRQLQNLFITFPISLPFPRQPLTYGQSVSAHLPLLDISYEWEIAL